MLDWSNHFGSYANLDFCDGLVQGLSGKSLEGLGLDSNDGRPGSSGGGIREVKKASVKVLHLYNSSIKVFDTTLCLSNYVFLCFQIFQHFVIYLEDPP